MGFNSTFPGQPALEDNNPSSVDVHAPLKPQDLASMCKETGRIGANMRLALPFYKSVLASAADPTQPPDKVARSREQEFSIFAEMVHTFNSMHEQYCGQEPVKPKTVTLDDLKPITYVMPFHALLQVGIKRAVAFERAEQEYFRKQGEMAAYVEQVKKYGLAGGRKLKDPSEWWDERTEETGFWQQEIFQKDGMANK